ncbi:MAG: C45 family autoproteolytic acyltransferase/hydrolase [Promethearchaeota archaeon]
MNNSSLKKKTTHAGTILPFVKVQGNHYQIGFKIGEHFRERIHDAFNTGVRIKSILEDDKKDPSRVNKAESLSKQKFPEYIEEIKGIADGSQIPYRDILTINFMHLPPAKKVEDCSTLILKSTDEIFLVHNEDHEYGLGSHSYLVDVHTDDGSSFISHCYPGCLPGLSFGCNQNGIAMSCNYVPDPINAIGITRVMFGRWILDAKNLNEAIQRAQGYPPRSGGVSYNLASLHEMQIVNIETTANDGAITPIEDRYFRSNHYISDKFQNIPTPDAHSGTTFSRYKRGQELLPKIQTNIAGALQLMHDEKIYREPKAYFSGQIFYSICTAVFHLKRNEREIELGIYAERNNIKPFFTKSGLLNSQMEKKKQN